MFRLFFVYEVSGIPYLYPMQKKRIQGKGENRLVMPLSSSGSGHLSVKEAAGIRLPQSNYLGLLVISGIRDTFSKKYIEELVPD